MSIYIPDLNIPTGENELVVCSDKQVYIREPDNYQSYSMRNSGVKVVDCTEMRPVVFCKDCYLSKTTNWGNTYYCKNFDQCVYADFFCALGETRKIHFDEKPKDILAPASRRDE